jgi:hypothetical protein
MIQELHSGNFAQASEWISFFVKSECGVLHDELRGHRSELLLRVLHDALAVVHVGPRLAVIGLGHHLEIGRTSCTYATIKLNDDINSRARDASDEPKYVKKGRE